MIAGKSGTGSDIHCSPIARTPSLPRWREGLTTAGRIGVRVRLTAELQQAVMKLPVGADRR